MISVQDQYHAVFPEFEKIEGHARLTEKTCDIIKEIYDIAKPTNMLEIGFNAGHTAFGWMTLCPELSYHSVDICYHPHTEPHAEKIKELFTDRFNFAKLDSKELTPDMIEQYDMVFIDGDHSERGLHSDYELCNKAKIKWLLIDDYTLRAYIYDFLNHIHRSSNHKYEMVKVYEYDSEWDGTVPDATSQMTLFRRID